MGFNCIKVYLRDTEIMGFGKDYSESLKNCTLNYFDFLI